MIVACDRPIVRGSRRRRRACTGPASEAWRLNREAMLLLAAGPRALLLQIAHPLIAEGVDQHSDFRADPWTPAPGHAAELPADRLRLDGAARGGDPAAQRAPPRDRRPGPGRRAPATAMASRTRPATRSCRCGSTRRSSTRRRRRRPLARAAVDRAARARFYAETRPIGRAFGIPRRVLPPRPRRRSRRTGERMLAPDGPVHPTPTARDLAADRPPPAARAGDPAPRLAAADALRLDAVAGGRAAAGRASGTSSACRGGRSEQVVASSAWLVGRGRFWRPARARRRLRWMPQARAADRRIERLRRSVEAREPRLEARHQVQRRRRVERVEQRLGRGDREAVSSRSTCGGRSRTPSSPSGRRMSSRKLPPWM